LKTLKIKQAQAEIKNNDTERAIDLPSTKLRGRVINKGLKMTLYSQIFFMNRSVQVSFYVKTVAFSAFF
jgi:hypothetical protein